MKTDSSEIYMQQFQIYHYFFLAMRVSNLYLNLPSEHLPSLTDILWISVTISRFQSMKSHFHTAIWLLVRLLSALRIIPLLFLPRPIQGHLFLPRSSWDYKGMHTGRRTSGLLWELLKFFKVWEIYSYV